MSEMITRVAKVLAEQEGFKWEYCAQSQWEGDARAAIAAMRDPTEEMVDAALESGSYPDDGPKWAWSVMIDAALK